MKNLHINVYLKLEGFLSSCKNKIMKAHDVFYSIKLKTVISPCKEIWHSWILNSAPWILHSGFFVSETWIPDSSYYKWDPEYLTFIPDSKRKISQIPDSLTWDDSDPKINTFSVKPKPVNWASNYCRLSVPRGKCICCSCHYMLEKGVCEPGEIVASTVLFQNQLGMIMKQL